jgi:hypothetical protein
MRPNNEAEAGGDITPMSEYPSYDKRDRTYFRQLDESGKRMES